MPNGRQIVASHSTPLLWLGSFVALLLVALAGCESVDLQAVSAACQNDYATLQQSNDISEECRQAIEGLLPQPEDDTTQRLIAWHDANNGRLYVAGMDADGLPLDTPSQVTLIGLSNGVEEVIAPSLYAVTSASGELSAAAVSAVDYSGSMRDQDIDDAYTILDDAYAILANLPLSAAHILYSNQVDTSVPLTTDITAFRSTLVRDDSYPRTSTAFFDAVGQGVTTLSQTSAGLKLLIVATDGLENSSTTYTSAQQLIDYAHQQRVIIIALGTLFADVDLLRTLASETGGAFVYTQEFLSMKGAVTHVAEAFTQAAAVSIDQLLGKYDALRVETAGMTATVTLP